MIKNEVISFLLLICAIVFAPGCQNSEANDTHNSEMKSACVERGDGWMIIYNVDPDDVIPYLKGHEGKKPDKEVWSWGFEGKYPYIDENNFPNHSKRASRVIDKIGGYYKSRSAGKGELELYFYCFDERTFVMVIY